ncbi:MAG: hypothetical protein ACYSR7_05030 [Planctomycetota bacterium]|jgi:hypothetical protein
MEQKEINDYFKTIERRNKLRTMSVLIFIVLIVLLRLLPTLFGKQFESFEFIFVLVTVFGSLLLILMLIYPYFSKITPPHRVDGELISSETIGIEFDRESVIMYSMKIMIIYYIGIPISILAYGFTLWAFFEAYYFVAAISAGTGTVLIGVILILGKINLIADKHQIRVGLGPLKDVINMEDVVTIRPISVRPFRDFMGLGKRVGPDGSIGYIVNKKTGVRIETTDNRIIVITLDNPQEFTDFVRYFKSKVDKNQ